MPKTPADDDHIPPPSPYTPVTPESALPAPQAPPPYVGASPAPYQVGGQQKPQTVLSLLAMIFGIVGIVLACCYGAGFVFSVAAIVLGHLGVRKESARGMALTGIITGYAGAASSIIFWIVLFFVAMSPLLLVPFLSTYGN